VNVAEDSASRGIERLVRAHLAGFTGYSASTSPETLAGKLAVPQENIVKRNANENPYGCSPRVTRALAEGQNLNIYPDDGQQELRKRLAEYTGVSAERIVAGHGSNTLIDLLLRLFLDPGDEVINCVPTFDIYRFSTEICGGAVVNIDRDDKFAVNVAAVKAAISHRTKLIFLANPNNPTGNSTPQHDILEIAATGLPLLVDEAYVEFSGETVLPLIDQYPNLMVLRSFSKWAGLAGLRVGYGIFPPVIASYLMAIKIPHNVSIAAEIAVRESLADIDYLQDRVKAIIAERGRLFDELSKIKWLKPFPSQANFIFCQVLRGNASELHKALQRQGILIRYFDKPRLQNSIRISVGRPEHTDALIKALKQIEP
jgi:histidinol-phosphate aminotransferase